MGSSCARWSASTARRRRKRWPGFSPERRFSANQIEFVNLIVDHLTEHGVMEAAMLYESPFTDLTPRGPDGLFSSGQVDELGDGGLNTCQRHRTHENPECRYRGGGVHQPGY